MNNKTNITIVTGLPGSGKTHYLNSKEGMIMDDQDFLDIPSQNDLVSHNLYISHPLLCLKQNQQQLIDQIEKHYQNFTIDFVCFENNPKQSLYNSQKRYNKDVTGLISYLSKRYYIPEKAFVLPVFEIPIHSRKLNSGF